MNNKPGQRNTNNQLFLNAVEASSMSVHAITRFNGGAGKPSLCL